MSDAPIAGPPENETVVDFDSDPGDATPLSTIGRYVVLDSVGMGGMGLVCAAYDPKLNRKVALKVLARGAAKQRARLEREAQALAQRAHPNVVQVYDVGEFEELVFVAMHADGEHLLARRPAESGDFTHIRWVFDAPLAPEAERAVRFVAQVD